MSEDLEFKKSDFDYAGQERAVGNAPKSKHTPGPWSLEFDDVPYDGGFETLVINGEDGGICMMDCPQDEMEANGRLIAAAPDLLEALQAFLDVAPSEGHRCLYCNVSVYGTNDVDDHLPDCEMAKGYAAIAKAKAS
jgi:hypothetical protein